MKLTHESEAESCEGEHDWPAHHPVTAVESLQHLPSKTLVYVAGRLIPPAPALKHIEWGGSDVPVSNAMIRNGNDLISVGFFRDLSGRPIELTMGTVYLFQNVRTHQKTMDGGKVVIELRAGKDTRVVEAPDLLAQHIADSTGEDADGGIQWGAGVRGARNKYAEEVADWYSLSVLHAICAPEKRRKIDLVCQVPSVFVIGQGPTINYNACSTCHKSWLESSMAPCSCFANRELRWRATLLLADSTAQVTASCFGAVQSLVDVYAEGDDERSKPDFYADPEHVEDLFMAVAAVPFTVRISFSDSDWNEATELTVQLATRTFDQSQGVMHPLKPIVQFAVNSPHWPPCAVADIRFEPGVGMTLTAGRVVQVFRALLEIMDQPPVARRGENPSTVRVVRRCVCALRGDEDSTTYNLEQNAGLEVVTRLLALPKQTYIHALVSWRSKTGLSLNGFWALDTTDVAKFRQIFRRETELHLCMSGASSGKLSAAAEETPLRIASQASNASASTGRQSWDARTPIQLFGEEVTPEERR